MRACFDEDGAAVGFAETLAELLERRVYLYGNAAGLTVSTWRLPLKLLEIFHPSKENQYVS